MINPSELRIGNLILPREGTEEYVRVTDIDEYGSIGTEAYFYDGVGTTGSVSEAARGIPLTPEWLEKCGFEEKYVITEDQDEIEWMEHPKLKWLKYKGDNFYSDLPIIDIKYMDQLQNLYFALTGEELTLKQEA